MKSYRDLIVWQKSVELVTLVYSLVKLLPEEEKFALVSQIKRCAVSVPSNIAEGYGRFSTKDYSRHLQIARGSLFELQTQLHIANKLNFITEQQADAVFCLAMEIEKMLNSLVAKLKS